ncbi:hypothetical protein GCM10008995_26670 [Halobellus salinus]|uniref:Uncharacterized protein n=1 Tax=Halobellus salinus TaxID=931585 RepID=A0A830EDM3_9EURY|nr:hypothetical protein [Halobellus salinus]GGJ15508.1 hypothetical protein GCM10008995_26670 [Halobellus salinus]SMP32912.1 hypothetical protein SAMN06265347_1223 [Halobellus salinus]
MSLASLVELYVSLGIFLVGAVLSGFSYLAWQRERDLRMRTVAVGYAMFSVYGLVVVAEHLLTPYVAYEALELAEHGFAVLILVGLLTFFVAITRG